jgi:hypothetical protein
MTRNFQTASVTAIKDTLEELAPGASAAQLVPLFDGKAGRTQIANWRAGIRTMPAWAVELLRAKIRTDNERRTQRAAQIKEGSDRHVGARNLAEYLARRR